MRLVHLDLQDQLGREVNQDRGESLDREEKPA